MLRGLGSRSDRSGAGTRAYEKQGNHRVIKVTEEVLESIPHITKC